MKKINFIIIFMSLCIGTVLSGQERTFLIKTDSIQLVQDFYPTLIDTSGPVAYPSSTVLYVTENGQINDTIGRPFGKVETAKFDGKYIALVKRDFAYDCVTYYLETKIDGRWVDYAHHLNCPRIRKHGCCATLVMDDMFTISGSKELNGVAEKYECIFDVKERNYKYYKLSAQREKLEEKTFPFTDPNSYPKKRKK